MNRQSGGSSVRAHRPDTGVANDVTQFEIDRTLDGGLRWLRFPAALERQFERDTGGQRARMLIVQLGTAMILFDLFLAMDFIMIRDVFVLGVVLRLGLITVIGVAVMAIIARKPPAPVREGLAAACTLAAAMVFAALVSASESPLAGDYNYGMLVIVMFAALMQRLRFAYAVAASAGCFLAHHFALHTMGMDSGPLHLNATALMLSTILLSLTAGYALELDERVAYLRGLRGRIQSDRFEALSYLDPLTGLGNRRALQGFLSSVAKGAPDQTLSLIMVDIDHFKSYNDHHGHLAGDDCLRRIGGMLVSEARNHGDKVYRFGGEEFVVALPGVGAAAALAVAERMRLAVQRAGIPHEGRGPHARVSASFGAASGRCADRKDATGLLGDADTALYEAKRRGRNRVYPPAGEAAGDAAQLAG